MADSVDSIRCRVNQYVDIANTILWITVLTTFRVFDRQFNFVGCFITIIVYAVRIYTLAKILCQIVQTNLHVAFLSSVIWLLRKQLALVVLLLRLKGFLQSLIRALKGDGTCTVLAILKGQGLVRPRKFVVSCDNTKHKIC